MDSQATTVRGGAGRKRHRYRAAGGIDARLRTHLLQHHLSAGHPSGLVRLAGKEAEEKPLQLLERGEVAALSGAGLVRHCLFCRHRHTGAAAGSLLYFRYHCHELAAARLSGRQQRVSLHCRVLRQLRFLSFRHLAALLTIAHHQRSHADHLGRIGMAQRTNLLQHHLSRRHRSFLPEPVLAAEDTLRCREMQELFAVQ